MHAEATALADHEERNRAWNLKSFMDSLIVELDRAQDVLAVKGLTRPVTYTVKDVDVDLRCFPVFDGRRVNFLTAQPGEEGSSGLHFSLGSISAGAIRDSAPTPPQADDVRIDAIDDLGPDAKEALESVGVRSGSDLRRIADRGIDIKSATGDKAPDYSDLAALITKADRKRLAPRVDSAQLSVDGRRLVMHVDGANLWTARKPYPLVLLNGALRTVHTATPSRLTVDAAGFRRRDTAARLTVALDPVTVVTMELEP